MSRVSVIHRGEPLPGFDLYIPFMSLPHVLGFNVRNIPGPLPYLSVAPTIVASWSERLGHEEGLRTGLVWAGNPTHRNDHNRSIESRSLLPLVDAEAARPHRCLQPASRRAGRGHRDVPRGSITDFSPFLRDFDDTAAAICALDRVVCVDTSVAHLAGALGRPSICCCPTIPIGAGCSTAATAWYPTVLLHRQPAPAGWASIGAATAAAVEHKRIHTT